MEIVLHPTLPSMVIRGPRVRPEVAKLTVQTDARQTLVAIVKATLEAGRPSALVPIDQQYPIFLQDIFFNSVRNADFTDPPQKRLDEDGRPIIVAPVAGWAPETPDSAAAITQVERSIADSDKVMRIDGPARAIQPLTFLHPVGGRTYTLSFEARTSATAIPESLGLVGRSGATLFTGAWAGGPCNPPSDFACFAKSATWPADVADTGATLTLVGPAAGTIDYDRVQIVEGAAAPPFDPNDPIRFEHDLAIFKPHADIVLVSDAPRPLAAGVVLHNWTMTVELNGELMAASTVPPDRFAFGWEPRGEGTRRELAGDTENFDPNTMTLPQDFDNGFFNGGRYLVDAPVFSFPASSAGTVHAVSVANYGPVNGPVTETASATISFDLPGFAPQATISYRANAAVDASIVSESLAMNLDTIVYEESLNLCYSVWRGIWDLSRTPPVPDDRYVRLEIS